MDWKHLPEWVHFIVGLLTLSFAVLVGTATRIVTDVRRGDRHQFWTRQLWLDVPALFMMIALSRAVAMRLQLHPDIAAGFGTVLGYLGPRVVDAALSHYMHRD